MKQSVLRSLSEKDTVLLLETERKNLDPLDEDALVALNGRVQRVRNKHTTNYRRAAASRVVETGSRGGSALGNQAMRDRAEVFEDALARVSRRLSVLARQSAMALRAERLEAARSVGHAARSLPEPAPGERPVDRLDDRRPTTPDRKKRVAGTAAAGARRQARKDNG